MNNLVQKGITMKQFEKDLKEIQAINQNKGDITSEDVSFSLYRIEILEARGLITTKQLIDDSYIIELTRDGLLYFDKKQEEWHFLVFDSARQVVISVSSTLAVGLIGFLIGLQF